MKFGAVFPQTEIGKDPVQIARFATSLEEQGVHHIVAYDHVIGADISSRPDWPPSYYTHESMFHEPLMLFSYLSGLTTDLEFVTGVLVLPQRQTALVAKQAANLDIFSGGRVRIGVGVGWNKVEYEALDVPFVSRGSRLNEQIDYLRQLWSTDSSSFDGRFHQLHEAGVNPLPSRRSIPIWVGGTSPAAVERAASRGDGWLPVLPAEQAKSAIGAFRERVAQCGRDPSVVGIESIVFAGGASLGRTRSPAEVANDCALWRDAGVTHVAIDTMNADLPCLDAHLEFVLEVRDRLNR